MAKRNSGRRGRARRRGASAPPTPAPSTEVLQSAPAPGSERAPRPKRAARQAPPKPVHRDPGGVGERPRAPWHPWPLSESLILVGAVATLIGFARGGSGRSLLFVGLGAVVIGTLEFTIREQFSGYRAHSAMLAAIPTAIAHSAAAFVLYTVGAPRAVAILVPLALDVPIFWFMFKALRARFEDARRERVFQLGRR